jgi:hypothetical protein
MSCFSGCIKKVDVEKKIEELFEKKFIPVIEKYLEERLPPKVTDKVVPLELHSFQDVIFTNLIH